MSAMSAGDAETLEGSRDISPATRPHANTPSGDCPRETKVTICEMTPKFALSVRLSLRRRVPPHNTTAVVINQNG